MRTYLHIFGALLLAASQAAALEKEFVGRIQESAKNVERDASAVGQALKVKKFDSSEVHKKIDEMAADITKLQDLVKEFEAGHQQLSGRDRTDWQLVKDKVQLLEIFNQQKKSLASEDLNKNRSLVRAHANGVAMRAQKLQQTAAKLQRD